MLGARLSQIRGGAPDHPEAQRALDGIGQLYEIDARAEADLDQRAELRRDEAPAVLDELKAWLWSQAVLKTLSIGKAAAYTIANWDRLTRFVADPRIPLDNNATERAIRGPVVGRKNHYGSKSRRGTQVAATLYTLLETAKLHGVDPALYSPKRPRGRPRRGAAALASGRRWFFRAHCQSSGTSSTRGAARHLNRASR